MNFLVFHFIYACTLSIFSNFCVFKVFFEGVENKISSGVKPEEVGYQLAFSKQELRKVIKEYPAKEVLTF